MWECQLGPERSHLLLDRSHRSPHGARALLIALALLCQLDLEDLFDRARFFAWLTYIWVAECLTFVAASPDPIRRPAGAIAS